MDAGRSLIFVNRFFYPDHSATSQLLSDLAFSVAKAGMRVHVVTSRGRYDDPSAELPKEETVDGVSVHRVFRARFGRGSLLGRAVDYLGMYRQLARGVASIARESDVVIAKTDPPLLCLALAPVVKAKRLILINWLQDLYPEVAVGLGMRALAPATPLLTVPRDACLRSAAINVAIGETMARRLISRGIESERIVVVPNWCADAAINPNGHTDNRLRREWGLGRKFVIGYSGNLGRAHEIETVLQAAELLRARDDIVFLFIGGGFLTKSLRNRVVEARLGHLFMFKDYQDASALPVSLSLPDVHWISLLPAMEGLIVPSKFYGVAAAGRPVIAVTAPEGEIARLVRHYDCGLQVAPGDGAAFARAILSLRDDTRRAEEMGRHARAMIDGAFSRAAALQTWSALLSRVGDEMIPNNKER